MELGIKSDEVLKNNMLLHDVNNILSGNNFIGRCDIDKHRANDYVIWLGEVGSRSSISEWMRTIWALCVHHENDNPWGIVEGFKWWSCKKHDPLQKTWYFGFKITRDGKEKLLACGGISDFTNEGRHCKEIAEKFMNMVWQGPVAVLQADYLISVLTGGIY